MDNIKFNQTGGFPLDTDILGAMQTSYGLFNQLGSLAGDLTILAGCEEVGNNVSEGIVFIAGEVLPFKGGTKGTTVIAGKRYSVVLHLEKPTNGRTLNELKPSYN